MKVGVYNRHWATMGGGERFAGGIAEALAAHHEVDLLGHDPIDVDTLGERLQLDLSAVGTRVLPNQPGAMTVGSRSYDLFVNTSYLDHEPSEARTSLLVVHFPARLGPWRPNLLPVAEPVLSVAFGARTTVPSVWGRGIHPATDTWRYGVVWTDGEGELEVAPSRGAVEVHLSIGRNLLPAALGPVKVEVEIDGAVAATAVLEPASRRGTPPAQLHATAPARPDGAPSRVVVRSSPTFVPAELTGSDDTRTLGLPLLLPSAHGLEARLRGRLGGGSSRRFLSSYDVVAANSRFTQRFIERWWRVDSEILYPPVTMFEPGDKAPIVLSVGRFFGADRGHSKKQLELVRAFRVVHERSPRAREEGWQLHLVGGCAPDDVPYLEEVQRAAEGLPVQLHVGASGDELVDLYRRASVFVSATGLGEDERSHPVRFEHFGISTVEAMSAGVVPVVLAAAGGLEIVRDGDQGLHFTSEDHLATQLCRVIDDAALRRRLAAAATVRARAFSTEQFAQALDRTVALALDRSGAG